MSAATPDLKADPASAKQGWPKTTNGTIDWEAVFEAPETGLIALLSGANSHDSLVKITETIIRQLFTRKGDEPEVDAFLGELTRIVEASGRDSTTVEPTRAAVIDLLRRIKTGRIEKALAYIALQEEKAANEKKRRRTVRRNADRKVQNRRAAWMLGGGALAAILAVAGVVGFLMLGYPPSTETPPPAAEAETAPKKIEQPRIVINDEETALAEQLAAAAAAAAAAATEPVAEGLQFSPEGYPLGQLDRADILELAPHVMTLDPLQFTSDFGSGDARRRFLLPVLTLRDPDDWSRVCDWAPALVDAITGVLGHQIPLGKEPSPSDYRRAGQLATQLVNQKLGGAVVDEVYLLNDVERSMLDARSRCRLVTAG